jgi:hypothetical protein
MMNHHPIRTEHLELQLSKLDVPKDEIQQRPTPNEIVGIDLTGDTLCIAVLDPSAAHYPWTDELHRIRSSRSLERFWRRRFGSPFKRTAARPVVCVRAARKPSLLLWLETQGAVVRLVPEVNLQPFYRAAADYEIPTSFRGAHALAHAAATKLKAQAELQVLAGLIGELNSHLDDATKALWRLAAVVE